MLARNVFRNEETQLPVETTKLGQPTIKRNGGKPKKMKALKQNNPRRKGPTQSRIHQDVMHLKLQGEAASQKAKEGKLSV